MNDPLESSKEIKPQKYRWYTDTDYMRYRLKQIFCLHTWKRYKCDEQGRWVYGNNFKGCMKCNKTEPLYK